MEGQRHRADLAQNLFAASYVAVRNDHDKRWPMHQKYSTLASPHCIAVNRLAKAPPHDLVHGATLAASPLNLLVACKLVSERELHISLIHSQTHPQQ